MQFTELLFEEGKLVQLLQIIVSQLDQVIVIELIIVDGLGDSLSNDRHLCSTGLE
jgi:hypothetical protein